MPCLPPPSSGARGNDAVCLGCRLAGARRCVSLNPGARTACRYEAVFLEAMRRVPQLGDIIKIDLVADLPMDARNK